MEADYSLEVQLCRVPGESDWLTWLTSGSVDSLSASECVETDGKWKTSWFRSVHQGITGEREHSALQRLNPSVLCDKIHFDLNVKRQSETNQWKGRAFKVSLDRLQKQINPCIL